MDEIQPIETAKEIGHKALRGSKWVLISNILSKAIQFITTIILARLLLPADFGIIAISLIIIGVVSLFQDLGMTQALIQKKEDVEKAADTVFVFNIFWSMILYVSIFIAASYIGTFFENNVAVLIIRILCLSFFLQPFSIISNAFMKRGFYFKRLLNITLLPVIFSSILSIILAYLEYGVWALVAGILISNSLNTILGWLSISWRPAFRFNIRTAKDMLSFGGAISIQNIIIWFENTFDDILVGRWLGTPLLGVYRLGYNVAIIPASQIAGPINDVVYTTFVRLQDNKVELKRFFLYIIKYISLVTFPIGVLLFTASEVFINAVLGEKWSEAAPVIQFVSIYGTIGSITFTIPTLCRAVGRPELFLRYLIILLFVVVPVFVYAVPYGLKAISLVHFVMAILFLPYNLSIGMNLLDISLSEIVNALSVSVIISAVIGVFIYIALYLLQFSHLINLLIIIAFSVLIYAALIYLISKDTFAEFLKFAKISLSKEV